MYVSVMGKQAELIPACGLTCDSSQTHSHKDHGLRPQDPFQIKFCYQCVCSVISCVINVAHDKNFFDKLLVSGFSGQWKVSALPKKTECDLNLSSIYKYTVFER
ncbi:hypothetical protein STEG23_007442, partial [Scotinomys teguina]